MNRVAAAVAAAVLLAGLAGCSGKDQPPAGVLPPTAGPATTAPDPERSPSTSSPSPTSSELTQLRPRGWVASLDEAAKSHDPKVVAAAFVKAMFLADSRIDDGNQQPFVRAVTLFGNANAVKTVTTGPQPPAGSAWTPMRDHDGWTTVEAQVEEEPDAEVSGSMFAASGTATVTFTDGHGWKKSGGDQYLLVMLVSADDGTWKVDDYRLD